MFIKCSDFNFSVNQLRNNAWKSSPLFTTYRKNPAFRLWFRSSILRLGGQVWFLVNTSGSLWLIYTTAHTVMAETKNSGWRSRELFNTVTSQHSAELNPKQMILCSWLSYFVIKRGKKKRALFLFLIRFLLFPLNKDCSQPSLLAWCIGDLPSHRMKPEPFHLDVAWPPTTSPLRAAFAPRTLSEPAGTASPSEHASYIWGLIKPRGSRPCKPLLAFTLASIHLFPVRAGPGRAGQAAQRGTLTWDSLLG